jgi:hypothetical protein
MHVLVAMGPEMSEHDVFSDLLRYIENKDISKIAGVKGGVRKICGARGQAIRRGPGPGTMDAVI